MIRIAAALVHSGRCAREGNAHPRDTATEKHRGIPPHTHLSPTYQHEGVEHTGDIVGVQTMGIVPFLPVACAVAATPCLLLQARTPVPRGEGVLQAGLVGSDASQGAWPSVGREKGNQ